MNFPKSVVITGSVLSIALLSYAIYNRNAPYKSTMKALTNKERSRMTGVSWLEGCPVSLDELVAVRVRYKNNFGFSRMGTIIVNRDISDKVQNIFKELYEIKFPLKQIKPIRFFKGHDPTSMRKNNSSAFRCSQLEFDAHKKRGTWSEHTKGEAIDINPLVNPFVTRSGVQPPEGEKYTDRTLAIKGMVTAEVVDIFRRNGFKWGGNWRSSKDYQHFSIGGR